MAGTEGMAAVDTVVVATVAEATDVGAVAVAIDLGCFLFGLAKFFPGS